VAVAASAAGAGSLPFVDVTLAEVLDWRGALEYIKFGLPSAAMTILEWWAAEVNVLLAGAWVG
jgi:hypothetical protein